MSPNACLSFCDEKGLLCGYPGEAEIEEPSFIWTYSVFEDAARESITPSMYEFMAEYVMHNISKESLYDIQGGDYYSGELEEEAVNAYYETPIQERITMHQQMLLNLRAERERALEKENAAMSWVLDDEDSRRFGPDNPIYVDVCQFVRSLVEKNKNLREELARQIHEEEQWRGGHEEGMSDEENQYDPMEE